MRNQWPRIPSLNGDVVGDIQSNVIDKWKGVVLNALFGSMGPAEDGFVPVYDDASGQWVPSAIASSSIIEVGTVDPRGAIRRTFGSLYFWADPSLGGLGVDLYVQTGAVGLPASGDVWQSVWKETGQSLAVPVLIGSGALPGTTFSITQNQTIVSCDLSGGACQVTVDTSTWPNGSAKDGDLFGLINTSTSTTNQMQLVMANGETFVNPDTATVVASAIFTGAGRRIVWYRPPFSTVWQVKSDSLKPATGLTKRLHTWMFSNSYSVPTDHGMFLRYDRTNPSSTVDPLAVAQVVPFAGSVTEVIYSRENGALFLNTSGVAVHTVTRVDPLTSVLAESQTILDAPINNAKNVLAYSANTFADGDLIAFQYNDDSTITASADVRVLVKFLET